MTRTVMTALPVWLAVAVAVAVGALVLPQAAWWGAIPAIAGAAILMTFVIQVSLQSKDGLVMRMLVTVTGVVLLLALVSGLLLIVTGVR